LKCASNRESETASPPNPPERPAERHTPLDSSRRQLRRLVLQNCGSGLTFDRLDLIYGSNRNFVLNALPHIGRLMAASLEEVLAWCDCLVVTQRPAVEAAGKIAAAGKPVIDLAGVQLRMT
jgi:hypothetical protein